MILIIEPIYNDPQEIEDCHEMDENCTHCGSDRKELSHYNSTDGNDYYRCLDCDEIYTLNI